MNLLQRYVLGRIVGTLATTVAGVLLLVWVVQALQRVNLVTDGGAALTSFLWIAFLILPRVLTIILPFALVIAVVNALNGMNNDSETVVVSAAGAGRRVFVVPVMALAVAVGLLNLALVHLVEPASRQAFRAAISDARADLLSTLLRDGQFRELGDDITVHIDARGPRGMMEGMLLSDRRDDRAERTYYASTASLAEREGIEYVVMRDGEVHSRDLDDGTVDIVRFTAYALDLSNLDENAEGAPRLFAKDRSTADLVDPDPEDEVYRADPGEFRAELHKRLTSWLYGPAFALVALHAAARPRSTRETASSTLAFVLVTCLLARGAGLVLEDAAAGDAGLVAWLYAVPLGLAALFGWALAADRRFVLPAFVRRARNRVWDGIGGRLGRLRDRLGARGAV